MRYIKGSKEYLIFGIVVAILFILTCWNLYDYNQYLIMEQQKEFLRLAKSVTHSISELVGNERIAIDEYYNVFLLEEIEQGENLTPIIQHYLDERPDIRNQIMLVNEDGQVLMDLRNKLQQSFFVGTKYPHPKELGNETSIGKVIQIAEHEFAIPVIKKISNVPKQYVIVFINMKEIGEYLNTVVEDEKDNGYVALKTQDGILISHKNYKQIGLHMVDGRKELYPDLDLSYLDDLAKMQLSGKESTYVYDSYWFSDEPIKKGKKVATFTPLYLDHEFWVVTLNLDYKYYILPLQNYMLKGILLNSGILLLIGWLIFRMNQMRVTQQKIMRENHYLQELNITMEELNKEREQRLHSRKMIQLGVMSSKLSHDFRNFLMPVIGRAEFLLEQKGLDEQAKEDVEKIMEYAEKASDLTKQLSKLSRYESIDVRYEYFDIIEEMSSWLESIKIILPPNIKLDIQLIGEHVWIYGNIMQMQEVLWNLCANAIDAMKTEGGSLVVGGCLKMAADLSPELCVTRYAPCYLEISIIDNGCGIDEKVIEHIFTSFYTTKTMDEGTGLGLSIAHDIIIQHGGDIIIESVPGIGSCFRFYLPCKKEQYDQHDEGNTNTIMLFSKNGDRANEKYFKKFGYKSKYINIMKECVKELEENGAEYEFVFIESDDGSIEDNELFMYICRNHPGISIFVITDVVTRNIIELQRKQIIEGHLLKPFTRKQVDELINKI